MPVFPLGDSAAVIVLGEAVDARLAARVRAAAEEIGRHPPAGTVDIVPAFASVAVFFDPVQAPPFDVLAQELEARVARADGVRRSAPVRRVEIPVCYGGDFGPDLAAVAAHTGISAEAVTAQHAGGEYLVHAIGFSPGFPYLGGLPAALATPRRATPRPRVPAGSVGIGGSQTGIYSLATPGGWNLIGRTPRVLFDPARPEPALLRTGDCVVFRPIRADEFAPLATAETPRVRGAVPPVGPAGLRVVRAGMYTTIQDAGRCGHRALGVPLSGAADPLARRVVNALVGNPEDAAGLEFTLVGPELRFERDAVIAVGGAEFEAVPRWRPVEVRAGTTLRLGAARSGCRGYLAIAGGIDVPAALGSRSTYERGGLGGVAGRALVDGDALPVPVVHRRVQGRWRIDERILPDYSSAPVVRVLAGLHGGEFDGGWLARSYRVSAHSDRMGVRLQGEPLVRRTGGELTSLPVAPGTIQVPPDGQPIVLLADAQTIGGYPQVAHVATVDLPLLAQLRPGDTVRFELIPLAEARALLAAREKSLGLLHEGLAQKLA
ncbi:MAG: 5-oxoprolinase subunit PxpB [Opitutaceae bacterium]|nr:5-oxoprolinase subunit PxpB [Opitutaceae bacterium]